MSRALWERFKQHLFVDPSLRLDLSRMNFGGSFFADMEPAMQRALAAMAELERGAIANPDENRMVGHYWLRSADLAPTPEMAAEIRKTVADVKAFAAGVHAGKIRPPRA